MGVIYSIGGLIVDILVTLDMITTSETVGLSVGTFYAFGALIGMPIITGFFGIILCLFVVLVHKVIGSMSMK